MSPRITGAGSILLLGSVIMFIIPYYSPADMVQFHWGGVLLLLIGVVFVIIGAVAKEDA